MQKFGWAFIGCGGIAHTVAKKIIKDGGHKIVSCWNRTQPRAEKFAAKFGCKAFQSIEEAITAKGVEGVYIAVTANKHADI